MAGYNSGFLSVPGGYDMKKLTVDGEGVFGLMIELNIYEDLSSNVMTGDLTLGDSFNLLSNTPFKEGSIIEIEAKNMSGDNKHPEAGTFKHKFEVIKIINRKTVKQGVQVYSLIFASGGWSSNCKTRVSRSFKQKKYSEIAQEIFDKDFKQAEGISGSLKSKSLTAEKSDGMFNIVIPNWKPLTIFNWLASRSKKSKACNYLFWEDSESFHFESVDKLMKEGPVAKYYHQTMNTSLSSGPYESGYYNVEEIKFRDTGDVIFYGMGGVFGNHLMEIDVTKKILIDYSDEGKSGGHIEQEKGFDYDSSFGAIKHADGSGSPLIDSASGFKEARRTLLAKHTYAHNDMEDYKQDEWFTERISQRGSLDYFSVYIWAMGSFKRKVGEKIEFMYASVEPSQSTSKKDKKVSGNYLIKAIRRKFNQTQYVMAMDIIKDNSLG